MDLVNFFKKKNSFFLIKYILINLVRVIDDYAAQKIRQIESKYPVINTPTEDVVNTFNEKTEPVRNVMNTVKDTTTSTIQHGKETVRKIHFNDFIYYFSSII